MSDVNSALKCKIWSEREKLDSVSFTHSQLIGIMVNMANFWSID